MNSNVPHKVKTVLLYRAAEQCDALVATDRVPVGV